MGVLFGIFRDESLVFLLGRNIKPNYDFLTQKSSITNWSTLKQAILKKVDSLDIHKITDDVKPFLINQKDVKKVELFREYLEQLEI